jgi:hypothetical protein
VESVRFTYHLRQFFPDLAPTTVDGSTVADVVAALDRHYAGIATYITDEHGAPRRRSTRCGSHNICRDLHQAETRCLLNLI